jgi:hypothetical protein
MTLSVSQYVLVSSTLVGIETRYYFLSECCCLKFAKVDVPVGRPFWQEGGSIDVEVTLRLTVGQSVCLGMEHPCGTCDQILLSVRMSLRGSWSWSWFATVLVSGSCLELMTRSFFCIWQLWVSWCSAPSLTRGWVCNLLVKLLLGLARAVTLGFKSRRIPYNILLSPLRLSQPGGPGSRIYIPREQGGPVDCFVFRIYLFYFISYLFIYFISYFITYFFILFSYLFILFLIY